MHMQRKILLPTLFFFGSFMGISAQTTRYVSSTGHFDGSSWANASSDLQLTINQSQPGDQIWVAAGTYYPNREANQPDVLSPTDRDNAFVLKSGVKIYGGFAGTETELSQRPQSLLTVNMAQSSVLSGDFNNDDQTFGSGSELMFTGRNENAYHVVLAIGTEDTPISGETLLDGFVITGGNANAWESLDINGYNLSKQWGGGIVNVYSNAIYKNITVRTNSADLGAAGMYNFHSNIKVTNSALILNLNSYEYGGGGFYNEQSDLTATNVLIAGNAASSGGGIVNNNNSESVLTNVTIANNHVYYFGGAIHNSQGSGSAVRNSILYGNSSQFRPTENGTIANHESEATFAYSLVQGSGDSTNWNEAYGNDEGNNIDTDPLFTNNFEDFTLLSGSPAIATGSTTFYATGVTPDLSGISTDMVGNPRIFNGIDMGAYEYIPDIAATARFTGVAAVVYPTPTAGTLHISAGEIIKAIELFDVNGRILFKTAPDSVNATLDLSSKAKGVYILRINTAAGIATQKIIKN
jgi:hypothetical protein